MTEPRIQYAKTSDGVNIAYWTLGEGKPFVHMPSAAYNPTLRVWHTPEGRRWCERLAEKRKFVRYDDRGFGHSDRGATDFSVDALVMDLKAVVDRIAHEKVALFGYIWSGPVAIAYAARHPERVSHLILWCTYARGTGFFESDAQYEALSDLAEKDWIYFTESFGQLAFGWSDSERARQYAAYLRESATPESLRLAFDATFKLDVSDLLSQVQSPTLVIQRRGLTLPAMNVAHDLAARIPNARLAVLEGDLNLPYTDDLEDVLGIIDEFLDEGEEAGEKVDSPTGMTAILFADIADSTALTERLGDAAFREKARDFDGSLRTIIRDHNGTPIEGKLLGDGVLATFASASQAIKAALQCGAAGEDCGLSLHLGIHAGDVIREENNVYGGAVNLAARIASASARGEVLVSQTVRDLARTSAGVTFEDCGERELKGVGEPVRLFACVARGR